MGRELKQSDERRQLDAVRAELLREFGQRITEAEVERRFEEIVRAFDRVPIRTFVPVLVGRRARTELQQLSPPG